LTYGGRTGRQSSNGIIISTGVGSIGWLRPVMAGVAGLAAAYAPPEAHAAPGLFIARAMFYVCRTARGRVLSITKASGTPRS
jgi:hypothetical protein